MGHYENYLERLTGIPSFFKKILQRADQKIFREITKEILRTDLSVLEIGIGDGSFYRLTKDKGWAYTGLDRNENMANSVPNGICTTIPPFPDLIKDEKFDLIYSAFVLEHMKDGDQAFEFLRACSDHLADMGETVVLVPDALSLGLEFWSIDYTHGYPTTERNVKQMAFDCGLKCKKVIRYRGPYIRGIGLFMMRTTALLYKYRIFTKIFGFEFGFYGAYQMLNQEILIMIFKKKDAE